LELGQGELWLLLENFEIWYGLGQAGGLVLYPNSTCRRGQIWDRNRDKSIRMKKYKIGTRIFWKGRARRRDTACLPDRLAGLTCGAGRSHLSVVCDQFFHTPLKLDSKPDFPLVRRHRRIKLMEKNKLDYVQFSRIFIRF
jgi:hypothetical protein